MKKQLVNSRADWATIAFFFLALYTSDDTLLFGTNGNNSFIIARYIVLVLFSIYYTSKKFIIKKSQVVIIVFLFYVINALLTGFKVGFIYNALVLYFGTVFCLSVPFNQFKKMFVGIVYVIALFSIILYFLNLLYPQVITYLPSFSNSQDIPFYHAGLSATVEGYSMRNFGLFREPGVYMIYLNIALLFEILSDNMSMKRVLVFILAIFTTLSTSGFLIGAIIMSILVFRSEKKSYSLMLIVLMILAYFYVSTNETINNELFHKIQEQTYSYYARLSSITVPLYMILHNPLGVGPDMYDVLFPKISYSLYSVVIRASDSTNTFLKLLAVYGPFIFIIYSYYFIRFCSCFSAKNIVRLLVFIVLLLCLSNEDLRTSVFFCIMIGYGIRYSIKKDRKELIY